VTGGDEGQNLFPYGDGDRDPAWMWCAGSGHSRSSAGRARRASSTVPSTPSARTDKRPEPLRYVYRVEQDHQLVTRPRLCNATQMYPCGLDQSHQAPNLHIENMLSPPRRIVPIPRQSIHILVLHFLTRYIPEYPATTANNYLSPPPPLSTKSIPWTRNALSGADFDASDVRWSSGHRTVADVQG
jgi:hypothetical protein